MNRKNLLSALSVAAFVLLALASTTTKYSANNFNLGNRVEDLKEKGNYIMMNDGTRVYGQEVKWKSGLLVKDQIQVDDEKHKISEVIGYRSGNTYYGRSGNTYVKRIVHG